MLFVLGCIMNSAMTAIEEGPPLSMATFSCRCCPFQCFNFFCCYQGVVLISFAILGSLRILLHLLHLALVLRNLQIIVLVIWTEVILVTLKAAQLVLRSFAPHE